MNKLVIILLYITTILLLFSIIGCQQQPGSTSPTQEITKTPESTQTPEPTDTPEPTNTPEPTVTPTAEPATNQFPTPAPTQSLSSPTAAP